MAKHSKTETAGIRVGISSCLQGQAVRFDGQHKKDDFLLGLLGEYVEWVPMCPEVESGMGTPREPMRLRKIGREIRLVTVKTGVDLTDKLERFSRARVKAIHSLNLTGFILKKKSPSCGMERVKLYDRNMIPSGSASGIFAAALMETYPDLPVEEEGRLHDPPLRENFIERLFAYHRLKAFFSGRWSHGGLVTFHTAHKLQLMAHSPDAYRKLGQLVAGGKSRERKALQSAYREGFMEAMKQKATPPRNTNALQHMAGYFKKELSPGERGELTDLIQDYRNGLVPLIVPITLLRHYVNKYEVEYLKGQTYLEPNPREMMLRNHV